MGTLSVIGLVMGLAVAVYCVRAAFRTRIPAARFGWAAAAPGAVVVGTYLAGFILVTAVVLAVTWFTVAHFLR
ncbi:hypothetical protein ABZ883_05970 [Streptomyces sp. NPDC046977]|uniref:hypothetical protein n=1 Tax=Streptomyces sp. NPDC046977 TaxID=3154703 RepID=UPI0033DC9EF1